MREPNRDAPRAAERGTTVDPNRRFHDLLRAGGALNYATRCRLVVDEVSMHHARITDPKDTAVQTSWSWLEDELGVAAATAGTIAERAQSASLAESAADQTPAHLRAWAWRRLGSPSTKAWSRGSESRAAWSLLMSPVPADEHELWWLASSNELATGVLTELVGTLGDAEQPAGD